MDVTTIAKYEILEKIGEGGFGIVYKGRDPFIKRLVAIKTCTSESEEMRQRFFREAEITGNLHHPNIVTIHEFGFDGDTPFLVQEFLSGVDLAEIIAGGEDLPLSRKVTYLLQIAEALDYAHTKGVVHRDVKPANIRVLEGDRIKVMDFGIARLKDHHTQLTQTGTTLGTVAYLSPEQLKGSDIDHRADIFSFGVLAYELLSGERPFQAETLPKLFFKLIHRPTPPLREKVEESPPMLAALVERCLEKDPDRRFESLTQVIEMLRRVALPGGSKDDEVEPPTEPLPPEISQRLKQDQAEPPLIATYTPGRPPLARLAVEARKAVETGDLTAAELTIGMARREYGDERVEERLGDLIEELESLQRLRDEKIRHASALLADGEASSEPPAAAGDPEPDEEKDVESEESTEQSHEERDARSQAAEEEAAEARRRELWEDGRRRIEELLFVGKIEEAGIHLSRLRPLCSRDPEFRRLDRLFKRARRAKLAGEDPRSTLGLPEPDAAPLEAPGPPESAALTTDDEQGAGLSEPVRGRPAERAASPEPPEPVAPPEQAAASVAPKGSEGGEGSRPSGPDPDAAAAVAQAARRVEVAMTTGRLEEAAEYLASAREEIGEAPELDAVEDRLKAVQRLTALTGLIEQAQKATVAAEFQQAQDLALEALKLDPDSIEARAVFQRAEEGLRRATERRL